MRSIRSFAFTTIFTLIAVMVAMPGRVEATSAGEIDHNVARALSDLYHINPKAREIGRQALAVLVFPSITKGGFLIAGQHGEGGLVIRGGGVSRYYASTAASYGLQAGVQKFGYALFFMNEQSLSYLNKSGGWELGSAPSLVVVDEGMAGSLSTTTLQKGVYAFFFNQKGLMGGLGLQGSKITRIHPD